MIRSFSVAVLIALTVAGIRQAEAQTGGWVPPKGHKQEAIWPGTPPDATAMATSETVTTSTGPGRPWTSVTNISVPTMTVFAPKGKNSHVAMLVFPGGGYQVLAMDLEGTEICDWLNSIGVTAVLVKYRVPSRDKDKYGESHIALEDAQRALSIVRSRAGELHVDPNKIGVIGFSAGGHLSIATSVHFGDRSYAAINDVDKVSARPDFVIACYPGHLWNKGDELVINQNVWPNPKTPPTFLVQAEDDKVDGDQQSLVYYDALTKAGVPAELHLYAQGGHGFGLRASHKLPVSGWPALAETWLRTIGIFPK